MIARFITALVLLTIAPDGAKAAFEDTMAQRLLACTGCHGEQGRAGPDGYYPRIAGKPAGYLYQQLLNFRDGRRTYPLMQRLLAPLSDGYLYEIAEHFAAQRPPYPPPLAVNASRTELARGEQLIRRGDPAQNLPACQDCHGERLMGMQPNSPGLLGLPRDYLNAQLGAWRNQQRHALAPDCMAKVATQLRVADIAAVTTWLAAQSVPSDAQAQNTSSELLRRDCANVWPDTPNARINAITPAITSAPRQSDRQRAGEYLAKIGNCAGCHTAPGGARYAGGLPVQTPFGAVYASNLTPDTETGIGRWSKDDFWRAMHEGRSRDDRLLYPAFPYVYFSTISRTDSDALFDWLQTLTPVKQTNRTHDLRWPYRTQWALRIWRALYFRPDPGPTAVALSVADQRSPEWQRGAYLVNGLAHCGACHTPRNRWGASNERFALTGALMPMGDWFAPSLWADSPTPADFSVAITAAARYLQSGTRANASSMHGPMAAVVRSSTQYLNDSDARAIATYLQADTELGDNGRANRSPPTSAQSSTDGTTTGMQLYKKHCAECHGKDGRSPGHGYPSLATNDRVTRSPANNAIQLLLYGGFAASTRINPQPFGMPPFLLTLSDIETAAVLTYIRGAWGNQASPISALEVTQQRRIKALTD